MLPMELTPSLAARLGQTSETAEAAAAVAVCNSRPVGVGAADVGEEGEEAPKGGGRGAGVRHPTKTTRTTFRYA